MAVVDAYSEALKMVVRLLRRNRIAEDPEEYVNEAYVQLATAGREITADSLYQAARTLALSEKTTQHQLAGMSQQTTKVCPRCKEDHPVAFFGLCYDKKIGKKRVNGWCRNCKLQWCREHYAKNRERIRLYRKDYDKRHYSKEVARAKGRVSCQNLYDGYIRRKLKQQGWKAEDITQEVIESRRRQILEKRARRVKKSGSGCIPVSTVSICHS